MTRVYLGAFPSFFLALILTIALPLLAENTPAPSEARKGIFTFGLAQERYSWYEPQAERFLASGTHLSIGYGRFQPRGILFGQAHVLVGPFPFYAQDKGRYEYQGNGVSIFLGISRHGEDLRLRRHNWGPLFGLEYMMLSGKMLVGSERPKDIISGMSLSGGLFYSWLEPTRLQGSTPELLLTRLDGVLASLSCTLPLTITRQHRRLEGSTLRFALHLLISP